MRRLRLALFVALTGLCVVCRKDSSRTGEPPRTPVPQIVYVVATPTEPPSPPPEATVVPTAAFQSTEIVLALPTRTAVPTRVDVASIPNMDRPTPVPPDSLTAQMKQCLSYEVKPTHQMAVTGGVPGEQLEVRVTNSCFRDFSASDSWFEVRVIDERRGLIAKQTGRFQTEIRSRGTAETMVQIDNCCDPLARIKYEGAVWWAAGGGKGPK